MVLKWVRAWSSKFFHHFGIHCATHQIRLILISGLVITSLFYPALGIYENSVRKFLPRSSRRVIPPLFGLRPQPLSDFEDDLDYVWSGKEALRVLEDPVARARCVIEKTVRVERVLLTSNGFDSDTGAINHELLHTALQIEAQLADRLSTNDFSCLSSPSRGCIVLSPLEFWSHDEHALQEDFDLLQTIYKHENVSVAGIPLRVPMVFAGRESAEPHSSTIDFAAYLALTYFFNDDDCNSSNGHKAWLNALHDVVPSLGEIPRKLQEPSLLTLEFNPERNSGQHISLITLTLYLSYFIFFVYFSGSMRRMDSVHSRIGLCFTGLVEIIVSTITSMSVCAIFGLRITLVPWGIFPIVIVFVGAENMFRLIDDVIKTPISLPVKERIGIGLSRAGTSNTLKVVSYNTILGVIAFFAQGAIRQFCAFAIVVLVAHWFLIHTFFVAVLSIDIQRLELDDLLRQNANLAPPSAKAADAKPVARVTILTMITGFIQRATKGRLAKNFSLLLLLVITAALYYSTLPATSERHTDTIRGPATRASVMRSKAEQTKMDAHSDAREIWRILSPEDKSQIHLKIEVPTTVMVDHRHDGAPADHRVHRSRWSARTLRSLWRVFQVIVLPIGATLGTLYGLLLYLLQGADRLENHQGNVAEDSEIVSTPIKNQPCFKIFPRTFATDVNLLASNKDGSVLASVSSDGELFLWLKSSRRHIQIDTSEITLRNASTSTVQCALSAITVDDCGLYCAVGTGSGVIGIWTIREGRVKPATQLFLDECSSPVTQLELGLSNVPTSEKGRELESTSESPCVLAVYANGRAVQWFNGSPVNCHPTHCGDVIKAKLMHLPDVPRPAICFFFDKGGLEIVLDSCRAPTSDNPIFVQAGSADDKVVEAHASIVNIEDSTHVLVAAVTYSGIITFWDGTTGDCVSTLDDAYGFVNNLRILPIPSRACSQCGEVPLCSFSLVYSVGHVVFVDRGIVARRCSCPLSQPLVSKISVSKDSSIGRRSRSGSFVSSSGADCVLRPRSRHLSLSSDTGPDVSSFPVSAHGMHSRRGSEKESVRKGSDKFDRPAFSALEDLAGAFADGDDQSSLTVPDVSRATSSASDAPVPSLWRNFRLVRVQQATCERGGWDIFDGRILGLRRKPRSRQSQAVDGSRHLEKNSHQTGLSSSILDRWEVWIADPSKPNGSLQASSLSALTLKDICYDAGYIATSTNKSVPRLSFTRLSPLVIKDSRCLAGFGNTVGVIDFGSG